MSLKVEPNGKTKLVIALLVSLLSLGQAIGFAVARTLWERDDTTEARLNSFIDESARIRKEGFERIAANEEKVNSMFPEIMRRLDRIENRMEAGK
ncbi:MAG TPA: hypothetical protein VFB99_24010 [Vicinamibacterales bacterium]|nr:hypothetical protein [Vicinamibacterales bacterium]